jgi:hypothetical protein
LFLIKSKDDFSPVSASLVDVSFHPDTVEFIDMFFLGQLLHDESLLGLVREWERKERGSLPSYVETCIIVWQEGRSPF